VFTAQNIITGILATTFAAVTPALAASTESERRVSATAIQPEDAAPDGETRKKRGKKKKDKVARTNKKVSQLCEKIECSEKQERQLQRIAKDLRGDLKEQRKTRRASKRSLADEFRKDQPNMRRMEQERDKLDRLRDRAEKRSFRAMLEVHKVLNDEQRDQVADAIQKRGPRGLLLGKGHGKGKKGKRHGAKKATRAAF
jgi:small-conductance mechanosensitive channel